MFLREFPKDGDLVMTYINNVSELGAEVSLPEYSHNLKGLIIASQMSRRIIRSIKQVIKVNTYEPCIVTRIDKTKNYIDLSKRLVDTETGQQFYSEFKERLAISKKITSYTTKHSLDNQEFINTSIIPLYKHFSSPEQLLTKLLNDYTIISSYKHILTQQQIDFISSIQITKKIKLQAILSVTCFSPDGIDGIKDILLKYLDTYSTETIPIDVVYSAIVITPATAKSEAVSIPGYQVSTISSDPNALDQIKKYIDATIDYAISLPRCNAVISVPLTQIDE